MDTRGYLSNRMLAERCERFWRHNQWKQLTELCLAEPRARAWALARINRMGSLTLVDTRARDLHARLTRPPERAPARTVTPPPLPVDMFARAPITEPIIVDRGAFRELEVPPPSPDAENWEAVDMASMEIRPAVEGGGESLSIEFTVEPERAAAELPREFLSARAAGKPVTAAEELVRHLRQLPPGQSPPLRPVEFRELACQLAEAGELRLFVELCGLLPARITGVATADLSEMLRTGARLREPVEWFEQAQRELPAGDERAQRSLDQMLLASVKGALQR